MIVKKTELFVEPKFRPVKLEITFESKDEMSEFYTVFNYCPIIDSLYHLDFMAIRSALSPLNYLKVFNKFSDTIRDRMRKGYENGK